MPSGPGREPPGLAPVAPAAGPGDLDRLVARTRGAGVGVSLELTGRVRGVPEVIGLSAYRIVQEALTNVVKHSGRDARASAHLHYGETALHVQVTDDGGQQLVPAAGLPAAGLPAVGVPAAGVPAAGVPAVGVPAAGVPAAGVSAVGVPGAGVPAAGVSAAGVSAPDTGRGFAAPGSGHGLAGMRERAHLCGGELTAGPLPGGGFQVTATLPLPGGQERAGEPADGVPGGAS
jgi:hypothetical protein